MNLGPPDGPAGQLYLCYPFEFSPPSRAKHSPEPHDIPNPATDSYGFDLYDLADNLEIHGSILG